MTISNLDSLEFARDEADGALGMDQESFAAFYQRTARPLWGYMARVTRDAALADDLMQETFYRFLRAPLPAMSEAHQRNLLFKIATNLMRDHWRKRRVAEAERDKDASSDRAELAAAPADVPRNVDLSRVLDRMKQRERELVWLAYVEGSNHREIAERTGLKEQSVRPMLFRARRKLARLLRKAGFQAKVNP